MLSKTIITTFFLLDCWWDFSCRIASALRADGLRFSFSSFWNPPIQSPSGRSIHLRQISTKQADKKSRHRTPLQFLKSFIVKLDSIRREWHVGVELRLVAAFDSFMHFIVVFKWYSFELKKPKLTFEISTNEPKNRLQKNAKLFWFKSARKHP